MMKDDCQKNSVFMLLHGSWLVCKKSVWTGNRTQGPFFVLVWTNWTDHNLFWIKTRVTSRHYHVFLIFLILTLISVSTWQEHTFTLSPWPNSPDRLLLFASSKGTGEGMEGVGGAAWRLMTAEHGSIDILSVHRSDKRGYKTTVTRWYGLHDLNCLYMHSDVSTPCGSWGSILWDDELPGKQRPCLLQV